MTSTRDIQEWAAHDAVSVLTDEQPEHFAFSVSHAIDCVRADDARIRHDPEISGSDSCTVFLGRWLNGGHDQYPGDRPGEYIHPTSAEVRVYRRAYLNALGAGIEACERGCDAEDYDADDVTEAATMAARGTLPEER